MCSSSALSMNQVRSTSTSARARVSDGYWDMNDLPEGDGYRTPRAPNHMRPTTLSVTAPQKLDQNRNSSTNAVAGSERSQPEVLQALAEGQRERLEQLGIMPLAPGAGEAREAVQDARRGLRAPCPVGSRGLCKGPQDPSRATGGRGRGPTWGVPELHQESAGQAHRRQAPAARRPGARTGWSTGAAAGTCWPGTSTAATGEPSGSSGSSPVPRPALASHRTTCPTTMWPAYVSRRVSAAAWRYRAQVTSTPPPAPAPTGSTQPSAQSNRSTNTPASCTPARTRSRPSASTSDR